MLSVFYEWGEEVCKTSKAGPTPARASNILAPLDSTQKADSKGARPPAGRSFHHAIECALTSQNLPESLRSCPIVAPEVSG